MFLVKRINIIEQDNKINQKNDDGLVAFNDVLATKKKSPFESWNNFLTDSSFIIIAKTIFNLHTNSYLKMPKLIQGVRN